MLLESTKQFQNSDTHGSTDVKITKIYKKSRPQTSTSKRFGLTPFYQYVKDNEPIGVVKNWEHKSSSGETGDSHIINGNMLSMYKLKHKDQCQTRLHSDNLLLIPKNVSPVTSFWLQQLWKLSLKFLWKHTGQSILSRKRATTKHSRI